MNNDEALLAYTLRLVDNALITAQRMVERVAGEPELEEELANANFALDYLGQARMFYSYAGELEGKGRTEDDYAYLRDSQEFRNLLMLEQICRSLTSCSVLSEILGITKWKPVSIMAPRLES